MFSLLAMVEYTRFSLLLAQEDGVFELVLHYILYFTSRSFILKQITADVFKFSCRKEQSLYLVLLITQKCTYYFHREVGATYGFLENEQILIKETQLFSVHSSLQSLQKYLDWKCCLIPIKICTTIVLKHLAGVGQQIWADIEERKKAKNEWKMSNSQ